jgi:hypothetical protein
VKSEPDVARAQIDREVEEQTASPLPSRIAMSVIDPSLVKLPIAKLVLPGDAAPPSQDVGATDETT